MIGKMNPSTVFFLRRRIQGGLEEIGTLAVHAIWFCIQYGKSQQRHIFLVLKYQML